MGHLYKWDISSIHVSHVSRHVTMNIPTKKANIYTYITKKSQHIYIRLYIWHISKKRFDDNRCVYIRTYIWISKMCVYIRTYIWISKKKCDDNRCHGKRRGKKNGYFQKRCDDNHSHQTKAFFSKESGEICHLALHTCSKSSSSSSMRTTSRTSQKHNATHLNVLQHGATHSSAQ